MGVPQIDFADGLESVGDRNCDAHQVFVLGGNERPQGAAKSSLLPLLGPLCGFLLALSLALSLVLDKANTGFDAC
jgi:hypothetical protein